MDGDGTQARLRPRADPRRRRRRDDSRWSPRAAWATSTTSSPASGGPRQRRAGGLDLPFRRIHHPPGQGAHGGGGHPGCGSIRRSGGGRWLGRPDAARHGPVRIRSFARANASRRPISANAEFGWKREQGLVDEVFHKVADRYDLMNDLMSGGPASGVEGHPGRQAPPFARAAVRPSRRRGGNRRHRLPGRARRRGEDVGDCSRHQRRDAAGRGDTRAPRGEGARVRFIEGDAEALPLPDGRFDAYTIASARNCRASRPR